MNSRYSLLAPALLLAALLAAFMTVDKLWLHWYTPDNDTKSVERNIGATPQAATSQPSAGATEVPSSSAGQPPDQQPTSGAPAGAPGQTPVASVQSRDAFAALWVTSQQAAYRVRYQTSSADGVQGDSYAVFNRPPAGRVDTIPEGESDPTSQIIVNGESSTIACSFDGGDRNCSSIAPFDGPLALKAGPIVFPDPASLAVADVADVDSRTVLGEPARCFNVVPAESADPALYCFNAASVPVYATGSFGIVEATELSSPSDADFVVTATP